MSDQAIPTLKAAFAGVKAEIAAAKADDGKVDFFEAVRIAKTGLDVAANMALAFEDVDNVQAYNLGMEFTRELADELNKAVDIPIVPEGVEGWAFNEAAERAWRTAWVKFGGEVPQS